MENLPNWLLDTKPTNKYLAWLLLTALRDTDIINPIHRKWIYKTAIGYLRLNRHDYSNRNHDWFEDCMKLMKAYREQLKNNKP